jgi:hypothetical protein
VTEILPVYRDEEEVVLDQIEAYYTGRRFVELGDQTPDDESLLSVLARVEAFIRVGRTGGAPIRGATHTDRPVIDIDVLSNTRAVAKQVAKEIEQLLMAERHPIDSCNVLMGPQRVPWVEGSPVVRMYASYQLSLRR